MPPGYNTPVMSRRSWNGLVSCVFLGVLLLAGAAHGQGADPEEPSPSPLPADASTSSPSPSPSDSSDAEQTPPGAESAETQDPDSSDNSDGSGAAESPGSTDSTDPGRRPEPREGYLPRLDVYFPEGDLDLRVHRLVNKVFFEGQVKYNFLEGDITAFLRYRYYGYKRTFQLTAFDAVEFDGLEELSDEFTRVRGLLGLMQWPHDYHHRSTLLAEIDRLITNKEDLEITANNKTNTYVRWGYQIGTPRDGRSNAIIGETRARVEELFTPFRRIGPGASGVTLAATYSFDYGIGDFDYVKLEGEALKRFHLGTHALVGRLHVGSFPIKERCEDGQPGTPCEMFPDLPEEDRYSIPRSELFRLDGREQLKGLDERIRGVHEIHTTWEYFLPWFLDGRRKALGVEWDNWYWVLYGGLGKAGFDSDILLEPEGFISDVGVGFESSFRLKKYRFFVGGLVATALNGQGDVEARLSIKSYH